MTWWSEDDGGPVAGLDPVFRKGYAPKLHGMLKAFHVVDLKGPVWADDPEKLAYGGPGESRSPKNDLEYALRLDPARKFYPILQGSVHGDGSRDLAVDEFFSHAEILSGQDVGSVKGYADRVAEALKIQEGGWIDRAVNALENTRASGQALSEYGRLEQLQVGSTWWSDHWKGPKGSQAWEAKARCSTINEWYEDFRKPALTVLAESLVRFGAIIHGARFNLDSLMGACVEQVERFDAEGVMIGESTGWKTFKGISDVITAGPARPLVVADKMVQVLDGNGSKELDSGGFYGTLYSFLRKADDLLQHTVDEVDALIDNLERKFVIEDAHMGAPSWRGPAPDI